MDASREKILIYCKIIIINNQIQFSLIKSYKKKQKKKGSYIILSMNFFFFCVNESHKGKQENRK